MSEYDAASLSAHYASMLDSELLNLALQRETLTDEASRALMTELSRRGKGEREIAAFRSERETEKAEEIAQQRAQRQRRKLQWYGIVTSGWVAFFLCRGLLVPPVVSVLERLGMPRSRAVIYAGGAWIVIMVVWAVAALVAILRRERAKKRRVAAHGAQH